MNLYDLIHTVSYDLLTAQWLCYGEGLERSFMLTYSKKKHILVIPRKFSHEMKTYWITDNSVSHNICIYSFILYMKQMINIISSLSQTTLMKNQSEVM